MPTRKAAYGRVKNVLLIVGGAAHAYDPCANSARQFIEAGGRYAVTVAEDLAALETGFGRYAAVIVFTARDGMTAKQEKVLVRFVRGGGGLVGVHSAAASFADRPGWTKLLGSRVQRGGPVRIADLAVAIADKAHQATLRLDDFTLSEEFYELVEVAPDAHVLAQTRWLGKAFPVMYCREEGAGRVFYTALGHFQQTWRVPEFQRSLLHGLDWSCRREPKRREPVRCAMLGYGASFNMGRCHSEFIAGTSGGMAAVAACDIDPARTAAAKIDFPHFETYPNIDELLKADDVDLVVNITPHHLHAPLALRCLRAGKHVVMEKPFCLSVAQADELIDAARRANVMLTVFHNRRWDGDFMTMRRLIQDNAIGDLFEIACGFSGYGRPKEWWRSDKLISGGNMYDWGAHFTDWVLQLMPQPVASVQGFSHKKVWMHCTSEDHTQAIVRFADGAMADICFSSISAAPRPRWRILGTRGAILDDRTVDKGGKVITAENGLLSTREVKWEPTRWGEFYRNVADHLLLGDELLVKPEQARRVIGVIECAERSSKSGRPETIPGE
jgi:predicted dehydrogenase